MPVEDVTLFVVSGLLGGLASALVWAGSWEELLSYEGFRSVVLGAIGGFLFWLIHTEWSVPNGVAAFVWGYAFKDIIEGFVERVKPWLTGVSRGSVRRS